MITSSASWTSANAKVPLGPERPAMWPATKASTWTSVTGPEGWEQVGMPQISWWFSRELWNISTHPEASSTPQKAPWCPKREVPQKSPKWMILGYLQGNPQLTWQWGYLQYPLDAFGKRGNPECPWDNTVPGYEPPLDIYCGEYTCAPPEVWATSNPLPKGYDVGTWRCQNGYRGSVSTRWGWVEVISFFLLLLLLLLLLFFCNSLLFIVIII